MPTLIDAGTGEPRISTAVAEALDGAPLAQVLVTHGHGDHASGAPALAARLPACAFPQDAVARARREVARRVDPAGRWRRVAGRRRRLHGVHTPGHAPDHLCFWHEPTRTLFCGDLAIEGRPSGFPRSLGGDLAAYLASLRTRCSRWSPRACCRRTAPSSTIPMALLRDTSRTGASAKSRSSPRCGTGDARPDAIVARIYRGLKASLVPLARESVTRASAQAGAGRARAGCTARRGLSVAMTPAEYAMNQVVDFINVNRDRYVEELKQYLAIPSISALPQHAADVRRARGVDRRRDAHRRACRTCG